MSFLTWVACSAALYAALMVLLYRFDRIVSFLLRPLHARLFPLAHRVARSLREEPDAWDYDRAGARAKHRPSGVVVVAGWGEASSVRFVTRVGDYKPGLVERRIVRDALDVVARAELAELANGYMAASPPADRRLIGYEPPIGIEGLDQRP